MKVYVEAQSKAALIRRLAAGEDITGLNYSMFGGGGYYKLDNTLEDGTIIAIYSQMSGGNPVAKSWGTWTNGVLKAETFEAGTGGKPLLKRQEKLLEQYRQTGGDAHYYDRLPVSLQEELKNIKFHETLHQAVDRWLSSNKPTGFSYSRWGAEDENQCSVCGSEAVHHYKNGAVQLCDKHFQQQFGRYSAETLMCPICDSVCDHDSQNLYDCSSCEIMWLQDEDGGFDFLEAESIPAGVGVIFK